MRNTLVSMILILLVFGAISCRSAPRDGATRTNVDHQPVFPAKSSRELEVRTISLPVFEPDLPPGRGREAFYNHCIVCHSSRYVTNQPPLSRKVWNDEVKKMIRNFGLQISEEQTGQVVDYLVTLNGPESKPPAN